MIYIKAHSRSVFGEKQNGITALPVYLCLWLELAALYDSRLVWDLIVPY